MFQANSARRDLAFGPQLQPFIRFFVVDQAMMTGELAL